MREVVRYISLPPLPFCNRVAIPPPSLSIPTGRLNLTVPRTQITSLFLPPLPCSSPRPLTALFFTGPLCERRDALVVRFVVGCFYWPTRNIERVLPAQNRDSSRWGQSVSSLMKTETGDVQGGIIAPPPSGQRPRFRKRPDRNFRR